MELSPKQQQADLCVQCDTIQQVYITLDCEHNYCLVCMSYVLIKSRTSGCKQDHVICSVCQKVTKLDKEALEAVQITIQQTVLPNVPKLKTVKQPIQELSAQNINQELNQKQHNQKNKQAYRMEEIKSKIKTNKRYSEEPSFEHITPSSKYFFSKCDSPIQKDKIACRQPCQIHPFQQIAFVCITCDNQILCLKCVIGSKHKNHNIKNIEKGMDYLTEQISMRKLELNQKIEYYEMWQRRLDDKKEMIKQKWEKSKQQIFENFMQIVSKLKKKQSQLIGSCNSYYESLNEAILKQATKLNLNLLDLKNSKSGFKALNTTQKEKSTQFFSLYNKIKNSLNLSLNVNYQPQVNLNIDSSMVLYQKEILPIIEQISKISLTFNHKIHSSARLQTNFTSLNSSREKKNKKKYSKTEEDEIFQCGLTRKTEQNLISTEKASKNKDLPAYVTNFLEKQILKPSKASLQIQKTSLLFEPHKLTNHSKVNSSKMLSKSIMPKEMEKKKKKHNQISNERIQRKTANPLQTLKSQKSNFQFKRKKIGI